MRSSGILMHITSLPSPYGVGTLGQAAYDFVDFLEKSRQSYWQILPVGPTGYGDSPYQTFSTFAGSPYLVDLDLLADQGLLEREAPGRVTWSEEPGRVDYGRLYQYRMGLLRQASARFDRSNPDYLAFLEAEKGWLENYALYMALKDHFGGQSWQTWPEEIRRRQPEAMERYRALLRQELEVQRFVQYEFFRQWRLLRDYAKAHGVGIIGDVPIYVPLDSADVWAEPEYFQLDQDLHPTAVAGVPPDYFSADGQLWGNPLYRWDRMEADGFQWWIRRMRAAARLFDVVRIDHFRGLESYWSVPPRETTARNGCWVKGPGMALIRQVRQALPDLRFIAEDLGFLTPEVVELVRESGFPGMKVLEFAFDPREPSDYLPHNYDHNCVCYTGTHDNETLLQWAQALPQENFAYAVRYLGKGAEESICHAVLRAGSASVAELFVAQLQDWLELGAEGRMNHPGVTDGNNWRWRALPGQITPELAAKIAEVTALYGRG